jgi:hypothetical protein
MTTKIVQEDIFSMFDIKDEYAEEKKRQEEERKKRVEEANKRAEERKKGNSSGLSNSSTQAKKENPFNVDMMTFVYHLGQEIPITDYFSVEEIEHGLPTKKKDEEEVEYKKIDANEVRERLEKTFPDLIAGYTEMVKIDKKNMIMAVPKAKKKGLDNNCEKVSSKEDPFSTSKRIPYSILSDFITLSKEYADMFQVELHADIYFDLQTKEFFMDIPRQQVSQFNVERTEDPYVTAVKLMDRKFIKIMEIHSHHFMNNHPSLLDDQSERQENVLYAIVGRVHQFFPQLLVRYFRADMNKHYMIEPTQVFETPFVELNQSFDTSVVEVL